MATQPPNMQGTYAAGVDPALDQKIQNWQSNIDSRYDSGAWAAWAGHEDANCPPTHPFRPDPQHMKGMGVDPGEASKYCVEKPVDVPHELKGTGFDGRGAGQRGGGMKTPADPMAGFDTSYLQNKLVEMMQTQGGFFGEQAREAGAPTEMSRLKGGGVWSWGQGQAPAARPKKKKGPRGMGGPTSNFAAALAATPMFGGQSQGLTQAGPIGGPQIPNAVRNARTASPMPNTSPMEQAMTRKGMGKLWF